MSITLIFKKSPRELRERRAEAPRWAREFDAYARDPEEADSYIRDEVGRDNPHRKGVVTDDGGKAETELRHRMLRAHGINNPERFD